MLRTISVERFRTRTHVEWRLEGWNQGENKKKSKQQGAGFFYINGFQQNYNFAIPHF